MRSDSGSCSVSSTTMLAGSSAQLRVQPLASRFGEQGVGKVQGGVGGTADEAFVAVDAAVRQVDHRLEARPQ